MATVNGLGFITFNSNPAPLYSLRRSLSESGFNGAARQVTAAIRRHNQNMLERVIFDWTCEWGANWVRPLELISELSLFCTFIYWIGLHIGRRNGLYLVTTGQRVATSKGTERIFRIRVHPPRSAPTREVQLDLDFGPLFQPNARPSFRRILRREFKALGTAFLFSLMSVFNIGFREVNFGRWIRMIQTREFDIRARGWMRIASGLQSLLGVALVALAIISYLGHAFD